MKSLTPNPSPIERGANRILKKTIREFVANQQNIIKVPLGGSRGLQIFFK